MDPVLVSLAKAEAGVSTSGIYTGSLCHADDLRSVTSNLSSFDKQVDIITRSLTLNLDKLDLFRGQNLPMTICSPTKARSMYNLPLPLPSALNGVVWSQNLSPSACTSIFGLGSLGSIMAGKTSVRWYRYVSCFYGSENWLLMLLTVEAFQVKNFKHTQASWQLMFTHFSSLAYYVLSYSIWKLNLLCGLLNYHQSSTSAKVFNYQPLVPLL